MEGIKNRSKQLEICWRVTENNLKKKWLYATVETLMKLWREWQICDNDFEFPTEKYET